MGALLGIVIVDFETFAHYCVNLLYVKNVLTGTRHKQINVKLASFEFSIVLFTDSHKLTDKLNTLNGVINTLLLIPLLCWSSWIEGGMAD